MFRTLSLISSVALLGGACLPAQDDRTTVRDVVDGVATKLLLTDKGTRVLGVQIDDSLDQQLWHVQFRDPKYKSDRRLIAYSDGNVIGDEAKTHDSFRDVSLIALEASEMTESAGNLRSRAHAAAKAAGIEPKTFRYLLYHPEGKTAARWYLHAYDSGSNLVGRIALNAKTSEVLATTWGAEAIKTAQATPKKSVKRSRKSDRDTGFEEFGRDVERTFKGIGGDLEEFFTGRRTVDR
mgnify:CR=1 FL=1